MVNNTTLIAATEAKGAVDTSRSLKDQVRAAMNVTKDFWLSTDETVRFNGAIAAVILANKDNESVVERITTEMKALNTVSALISGVSVDFERSITPDDFEPIGLHRLWMEIGHNA